MDLSFPLRFSFGSLKLTTSDMDLSVSHIKHLLSTVYKERALSDFGTPVDVLFNTGIPEILTERIRLAIKQLQLPYETIDVRIISYIKGVLQLEVRLSFTDTSKTINVSFFNG